MSGVGQCILLPTCEGGSGVAIIAMILPLLLQLLPLLIFPIIKMDQPLGQGKRTVPKVKNLILGCMKIQAQVI